MDGLLLSTVLARLFDFLALLLEGLYGEALLAQLFHHGLALALVFATQLEVAVPVALRVEVVEVKVELDALDALGGTVLLEALLVVALRDVLHLEFVYLGRAGLLLLGRVGEVPMDLVVGLHLLLQVLGLPLAPLLGLEVSLF